MLSFLFFLFCPSPYLEVLESVSGDISVTNCEKRLMSDLLRHRFYVLITPLLGSCLGRQGSSGSGSWANTESSPEEQVLLES